MTDQSQWPDGDSGTTDAGDYGGPLERPEFPGDDASHPPAIESDDD